MFLLSVRKGGRGAVVHQPSQENPHEVGQTGSTRRPKAYPVSSRDRAGIHAQVSQSLVLPLRCTALQSCLCQYSLSYSSALITVVKML